ncbi:hypothetical protein BKA70DRAFT_337211 [Coprinopsis sp. MPI-PUGE-AT-0042]|nr:hypothetical protein BKA70DRAFT_337211 [Coprinopsis sp. MPI-PUGE-AT-0042]
MNIVFSLCLRLIHSIYALYIFLFSYQHRKQWQPPQPLKTPRHRIPKHIALILETCSAHSKDDTKDALVASVSNATSWCREVGIQQLTVYERNGLLSEYDQDIRSNLLRMNANTTLESDSSESETEYQPLTPPPSDYSDSRPISPSHSRPIIPSIKIILSDSQPTAERKGRKGSVKRRNRGTDSQKEHKSTLVVSLISQEASKDAIATAANTMAENVRFRRARSNRQVPFGLTVEDLESLLEGDQGFPSPDFMIVHSLNIRDTHRKTPLELFKFPPWQIRLTEIYHSRLAHINVSRGSPGLTPYPLDETVFREALDEFAGAEFRFGK